MRREANTISLRVLFSYGSVPVPLAVMGLPLIIYLSPFYASEIGLPLTLIGSMLFIGRITDVITDPLVGFLSDNTRSKFGRRTVWMVLGSIIMLIAVPKLFIPPPDATIWYLLIWIGIVFAGLTMVGIPHESLSAELSPDYHERTRISGARQIGNLVGLIIATTIPALILTQTKSSGDVLKVMAYAFMVLIVIAMVIFIKGVKEKPQVITEERIRFTDGLKIIAGNKPFIRLFTLMAIANLGESFRITITWFYAGDIIGIDNIGMLYVYYFAAGLLSVPMWVRLAHLIGKHRALTVSFSIVALSGLSMYFLEYGDRLAFTALFVVKGLCFGSFQLLPQAMTADIVDIDHLESGEQRQGAYYAILHMLQKFSSAFGQGLSLFLLGVVGYSAMGDSTEAGLFWLRNFYTLVPVVFMIIAGFMTWGYPITAAVHEEIRARIKKRDAELTGSTADRRLHPRHTDS